jgi:hypothetical protein
MEVNGIFRHEALEEGGHDIDFGDVGGDVRIQIRWIGMHAAVENLIAVAALHGRFPL